MRLSLRSAVDALTLMPFGTRPLAPLMRGHASIFMLHRFRDDTRGVAGHDPDTIARFLAFLRRERYDIVSLEEMLTRLAGRGAAPDRAVAFTMDDGTAEQVEIAAPLFASFDCPVTLFVVTGYLDGRCWLWWHAIEHAFHETTRTEVAVPLGGATLALSWSTPEGRRRACEAFTERCKEVTDQERIEGTRQLVERLGVDVTGAPPARYAPISWGDARRAETMTMRFAPHGDTHAILARADDAGSRREITRSWERLREEVRHPVPIFCWPNGTPADYGPRETGILDELGFLGAMGGIPPGFASRAGFQGEGRFLVPRLDTSGDLAYLVRSVSGVRRVASLARGLLRGRS